MSKLVYLLAFILFFQVEKPVEYILFKSIKFDQKIHSYSFDKKGNIYVVDNFSNVFKFDSNLKKLFHFSPNSPMKASNFDATNTSQIMVFSEERQEYIILDWLLSPIKQERFNENQFGYISIMGQSATNLYWIIDNSNYTLSKYNIQTKEVIVETHLEFLIEDELHPLFIKEYQNFLYISTEKNGILVFDNLGNYKKKLPFNNISYFYFENNSISWNKTEISNSFHLMSFKYSIDTIPKIDSTCTNLNNKMFQIKNKELRLLNKKAKN